MNTSTSNFESQIDQFEKYTLAKMSLEERQAFETKLLQSPEFHSSFDAFLISRDVINEKIEAGLRDTLKQWQSESKAEPKIVQLSWLKYAAAASIIAVISLVTFQNYRINKIVDSMIATNLPLSETTRGEQQDKISKILADHENKAQDAILELKKIDSMDQNYGKAQSVLAKFYIRQGNCVETLKSYANAHDYGINDVTLGILLCQMKCNKPDADFQKRLDSILADSNNNDYQAAKKINEQVNGFWWKLLR
ncbi:MAG: hypothetical protein ABI844_17335 [Saprospiraceae bacterium]